MKDWREFPRSRTGYGIHDAAYWADKWDPAFVRDWILEQGMSCFLLLTDYNDIHMEKAALAEVLAKAGIRVYLRIYKERPHPYSLFSQMSNAADRLKRWMGAGVSYVLTGNERWAPLETDLKWLYDVACIERLSDGRWTYRRDKSPWGLAEKLKYQDQVNQDLQNTQFIRDIAHQGGWQCYPAIADMIIVEESIWPQPGPSQEEDPEHFMILNKYLYYARELGKLRELFEESALSHHCYTLNRPAIYPYDQTGSHSRSFCAQGGNLASEILQQYLGYKRLVLLTEAGPRITDKQDPRYAPVTENWERHKELALSQVRLMKPGQMRGYYPEIDGLCFWLFTDRDDPSRPDNFANEAWWSNPKYSFQDVPIVLALRSEPRWDRPTILPSPEVKFSWTPVSPRAGDTVAVKVSSETGYTNPSLGYDGKTAKLVAVETNAKPTIWTFEILSAPAGTLTLTFKGRLSGESTDRVLGTTVLEVAPSPSNLEKRVSELETKLASIEVQVIDSWTRIEKLEQEVLWLDNNLDKTKESWETKFRSLSEKLDSVMEVTDTFKLFLQACKDWLDRA